MFSALGCSLFQVIGAQLLIIPELNEVAKSTGTQVTY